MIGLSRTGRAGIAGLSAVLILGSGAAVLGAPSAGDGPADTVGAWTEPFGPDGPEADGLSSAVIAAVLPDGRVFYADDRRAGLLDLRSGGPRFDRPQGSGPDLAAADLTTLPDGRLLLVGGAGDGRNTRLFDPATNTFGPAGAMKAGRWNPHLAVDRDGQPTVFGGATAVADTPLGSARRTETYQPRANTWQEDGSGREADNELPLGPRVVLAPNGKFFYAAAGETWGPSGQSPDEATTSLFQFFDPRTRQWQATGPAPLGARSGAFTVPLTLEPPYDRVKVLTGGGVPGPAPGSGTPAQRFTTLTTVDDDGGVYGQTSGDLNHARWYASAVLLPDDKVLAVGGAVADDAVSPGTAAGVRAPELYDPSAGTWAEVAPHRRDRGYHHSALLLPDMRVLLGGHADRDASFEIWSPPYLFRGPRPRVRHVQAAVPWGTTFDITTPDAGLVESVLLMRTPSPGHANDSDQRAFRLEFTRRGTGLITATAPPSSAQAPLGPYYLVINGRSLQGPVPSVARIVHVGSTDLSPAPQPYPDDPPAPAVTPAKRGRR